MPLPPLSPPPFTLDEEEDEDDFPNSPGRGPPLFDDPAMDDLPSESDPGMDDLPSESDVAGLEDFGYKVAEEDAVISKETVQNAENENERQVVHSLW